MDQLIKLNIWILVCLLVGFTACADLDNEPVQKENNITIRLSNHKMSRSVGVEKLNENLIQCADIFFFAVDANSNPTGNCLLHHQEKSVDKQTTHDFPISLKDLTPNTSYYIYAIANLETISAGYNGTIGELKALTATPISVTTGEKGNNGIQDHFVMDGFNNTFIYKKGMTGTTEILLTRSAAKITLTVNVANDVVAGGTTYFPEKEHMTVELMHGEANGVVNGVTNKPSLLKTGQYEINKSMTHDIPFYSYPTNIERTISDESKECYLELMIPWTSENGTVRNYYYHIPIEKDNDNNTITALERNHHYMMTVEVSILGSLEEEETVDLLPKYVVQNWSEVALDADLKNYRYLWVKEPINGEYWEMKNTEVLEIPYNSSHPCERIIVKCKQPNLYRGNDEEHNSLFESEDPGTDPGTSDFYCGFVDGKIVYKHGLDNNYESDYFDFTPYDIEITIQHVDDNNNVKDELSKTIKIKQYPAIYAEAYENSDGNTDKNNGYTFVNGYYSTTRNGTQHDKYVGLDKQDRFNSVPGLVNTNASPNMYVFTVTSVEGTNYIIGDPREKEIDSDFINAKRVYYNPNDNATAWVQANALYDGTSKRGLKYYYATEVDDTDASTLENSRTKNIIAPKFRIASAYGVLHNGDEASEDLEGMKKRCASYQEDGYPAGRWRLPTEAEFQFILSMVNRKVNGQASPLLPQMYIEGADYWCAHGLGYVQNDGTVEMSYISHTNDGESTRCVYDDWYWGSEPALTGNAKSTFTWGDEPINK